MANATVYKKKKTSLFKSDGWKRFRKNKLAVIGLCVILLMVLAAVFAPVLVQNDPYMILETPEGKVMKDMSPSASGTILGTDNVGRDELSRLIYGARVSMSVGIVSVGISLVVGVLLDMLAVEQLGLQAAMFRTGMILYIVATEGISVLENLGILGVPLPGFVVKALEQLREKSDTGAQKEV